MSMYAERVGYLREYNRHYRAKRADDPARREQLRAANRRWYEKSGKARAIKVSETERSLRSDVFKFFGSRCIKCGFSDHRALQIDHVNGGGSKERRKINRVQMFKRILTGTPGYQLLCANCNWIKRVEQDSRGPTTDVEIT